MIFWNCYSNEIIMAMRVGKETYYMAAIYLAPFYLLVCIYPASQRALVSGTAYGFSECVGVQGDWTCIFICSV